MLISIPFVAIYSALWLSQLKISSELFPWKRNTLFQSGSAEDENQIVTWNRTLSWGIYDIVIDDLSSVFSNT